MTVAVDEAMNSAVDFIISEEIKKNYINYLEFLVG